MQKKECKNCKHSRTIEETITADFKMLPEINECSNPEVTFKFMQKFQWREDLLAENCKHYSPKPVGECGNCKEYIKAPIYQWEIYSKDIFGKIAVCSESCRKELDEKINKYKDKKEK